LLGRRAVLIPREVVEFAAEVHASPRCCSRCCPPAVA
jgi:hypothetical protein